MSRHLVFIPAYNCARQIARVLRQFESLPTGFVDRVLVIDNRSTDETLQVACDAARQFTSCEIQVCRNVENYGLGGSQKVGFAHADRKSTRLNSSHSQISYAVFCLKKKKKTIS